MGLDGVQLVMEIEDEFGITIPDSAYSELRTVGNLVDFSLERIHASKTLRCPSLTCFLSLRRLVRDVSNDPELRIRPRDKVEDCLPEAERKQFWRRLPELLETTPPDLRRPPWLRKTLLLIVLGFPILLMAFPPWHIEILILISCATIALGIVLHWSTIGLRTRTPEGYKTFGDITKRMVGLTIATNPPTETDYDSVFSIVKRIVVDQLGVDDDEVVPTARFIEDLGVD
ncbi:acyl carrier protein [uncultured Gimesia sp.]|uniref:acyl carrier protein n=1 Tax=uncultured Gimesia sp. TaxID=1678688 RepID=UPI002639C8D7|nr:acyl carrier protein [uncultured Gimesia sp.]